VGTAVKGRSREGGYAVYVLSAPRVCPVQGYPLCREEVSDDVAFVLTEAVAGMEAAPARELMLRVLSLHPRCSGAMVCLGAWYSRQGRALEAIRCFQEAQKVGACQ
jgi:hypothetical protein